VEIIPSEVRKGSIAIFNYVLNAFLSALVAIIATRKLSPNDFGDYQFLALYSSFFTLGISTLAWFITRFTARGYDIRKEGFILSFPIIFFSSLILFFTLLNPLSLIFQLNFLSIVSALSYFISLSFFNFVSSIIQGKDISKPSIGNLIQAFFRVLFLFIAIYILLIQPSVALFLFLSAASTILGSLYLLSTLLNIDGKESKGILYDSLKKLWHFPLFLNLVVTLMLYDSIYLSIFISSTLPLAYFRAAYIIANLVTYSQSIAVAYYRSFLEKESYERIPQAIKAMSLFSFLSAFLIISLGDLLLGILRPTYALSYYTLILLSLAFIIGNFSTLFSNTILSMDKVDIDTYSKKYRESYFYFIFKVLLLQIIIQYSWLTILGIFSKMYIIEPYVISLFWSMSWLFGNLISCILLYYKLKNLFIFKFPTKNILIYLFTNIIPCIVVIFFKPKQIYQNVYLQLLSTIPYAFLYMIIFLSLLIFFDKSMRTKLRSFIKLTINHFKFSF